MSQPYIEENIKKCVCVMWKTKKWISLTFSAFSSCFGENTFYWFFRTISYAQFHRNKENISSLKCSIKLSLSSFSFFFFFLSDVVSQNLGIVRVSLKKTGKERFLMFKLIKFSLCFKPSCYVVLIFQGHIRSIIRIEKWLLWLLESCLISNPGKYNCINKKTKCWSLK